MASKSNIKLKSFENMFKSTDPERLAKDNGILKLSLDSLEPFKEHPFKGYSDEKMAEMVESIKQHGVMSPIIVRGVDDGKFEILSGHNRVTGARIAGLELIPAIVVEADDDTAMVMMIESNLNQRENILPSERGKAYKLQLEALNSQGKRTDLTSPHDENKLSVQVVAENNKYSKAQIHRYVRLTSLIPDLLNLVDESKLSLTYGVDLSYLSQDHQLQVYELLEDKGYSLNSANIGKMKELEKAGELTDKQIKEVILVQKQKPRPNFHKQLDKAIKKFKLPEKKAMDVILKALEWYMKTDEFQSLIEE